MPAERLRRHLHPAVLRADSAESSAGIPVIMPGERFPVLDSALIRYLATSERLARRFPSFETEIHGIAIQEDGSYRVPCLCL